MKLATMGVLKFLTNRATPQQIEVAYSCSVPTVCRVVYCCLQYGLYTAYMACFVYCLLGTSKDVNLGPAAVMSLLTAEFGHSPAVHDDATYAIALSLVCGIFQIIMGCLHVGPSYDAINTLLYSR